MNYFKTATNEFLLVRICAVLMFFYTAYIITFIASTPSIDYPIWKSFFDEITTKVFTLVFVSAFAFHTWHGLTAIGQDYLHTDSTFGRLGNLSPLIYSSYRLICAIIISIVFIWSLLIIW